MVVYGRNGSRYVVYAGNLAFRVYVRKNGACSVTCIRVAPLFRRIGIEIKKSTRYNLIEASEEGFYKIEGLKTK
jgi:hypothetical protein